MEALLWLKVQTAANRTLPGSFPRWATLKTNNSQAASVTAACLSIPRLPIRVSSGQCFTAGATKINRGPDVRVNPKRRTDSYFRRSFEKHKHISTRTSVLRAAAGRGLRSETGQEHLFNGLVKGSNTITKCCQLGVCVHAPR